MKGKNELGTEKKKGRRKGRKKPGKKTNPHWKQLSPQEKLWMR